MKNAALACCLLLFAACYATPAADNDDVPRAVQEAFAQKYPGAENVRWSRDKNDYHEAHFTLDGEKYRADFEKSGKWIETEQNVKKKDLPKAVEKVIEDKYDKPKIYEVELVDHHSKGVFYDVEIKHKGKKLDVMVRRDGQIIGTD